MRALPPVCAGQRLSVAHFAGTPCQLWLIALAPPPGDEWAATTNTGFPHTCPHLPNSAYPEIQSFIQRGDAAKHKGLTVRMVMNTCVSSRTHPSCSSISFLLYLCQTPRCATAAAVAATAADAACYLPACCLPACSLCFSKSMVILTFTAGHLACG